MFHGIRRFFLHTLAVLVLALTGLSLIGCGGSGSTKIGGSIAPPDGPPNIVIIPGQDCAPARSASGGRPCDITDVTPVPTRPAGLYTVRSLKQGDFFTLSPEEILGDEDSGGSWLLSPISAASGIGTLDSMTDWSADNPWSYQVPDDLPNGRYALELRTMNNISNRMLNPQVILDINRTGHSLPGALYPDDMTIRCEGSSGRLWLDKLSDRNLKLSAVRITNPATGKSGFFWTDSDDLGIEIEVSQYWLHDEDVQMFSLYLEYWDQNNVLQGQLRDIMVDESCRVDLFPGRKATDTPPTWTPTPGVQRQR